MVIDWLAAGLNPGVATLFIQSKRAGACGIASAAVDDHAAGLAGARALLQGSAGAARGPRSRHLRLSRLPAAAVRGHPDVPVRSTCRWARTRSRTSRSRARSRAASITSTAASRNSRRRPKRRSRAWVRAIRRCTARCARNTRKRATPRRSREARALVEANARLTVADRDRLLGFLEGTGIAILPEPEALLTATPKVPGPRRPQDVEVLRQHHRAARGPGFGRQEAQGHADRSGARAPHRSRRSGQMSGLGSAQDLFERRDPGVGRRRAAAAPASAASSARRR